MLRTLHLFALALALAGPVVSAHSPALLLAAVEKQATPLDACCDHGTPPAGETPSRSDNCCPDGCHDCPLPCCRGSVAVAGNPLPGLIVLASAPSDPTPSAPKPPASEPSRIDHPPRV